MTERELTPAELKRQADAILAAADAAEAAVYDRTYTNFRIKHD